MKIVIIDNYDSFTYNLFHLLRECGADTDVVRNDKFVLADLQKYDKIVLSPGPGVPSEAGLLLDVIDSYAGKKPILGVCLGHQAIGQYFGAKLTNLDEVFHGVQTEVEQCANDYIFNGLPLRFAVGRYHSWVVDAASMPDTLQVTAESDERLVMALRHRDYDIHGIQFHPESVLTPDGRKIIENFINNK